MKIKYTIIVIFITALCAAIPARAQWKEIFSYPSQFHGITFLDIYFLESDPNYGWICGFQGTVLYTTDAGQNWLGTRIPTVNQLESIYFPTPNIGYTSGEGQIHKSTDGGRTWRDITPTMAYTSGLWGNFFLDENVGMVIGGGCGSQQMFFRTTDGGATWDYFSESVLESGLCDVVLYDENGMGYASSSGLIWQTDDGGRTWRVMSVSGQRDWQEEIAHKGNTFLVPYSTSCTGGGGSGGARMSLDHGANWIDVNFGYAMFGAFLLDERRGWVVGWNATAAYTNDGGKTWENRNCGLGSRNMDDIWFVNDSIGWVVGEGVFKTMQINTLLPEIAATANSICEGDSVVLTTSREYISYRWSTGETTRSITVTEPGRYFVFVRNDSCAQGESAPIFVDVAPAPELTLELSETEPPCQGDTIYISPREEFALYDWRHIPGASNDREIAVTESGEYTLTAVDSNGCEATRTIRAEFLPAPDPSITVIGQHNNCEGDTLNLVANEGYSRYVWYIAGEPVDSGANSYEVYRSGSYRVYVETAEGCRAISDPVELTFIDDSNRIELLIDAQPLEIDFDSTAFPGLNCRYLYIRNRGGDPITLDYLYILQNLSFSAPPGQFPITIAPYDTARIEICHAPRELKEERDTAIFSDNCSDHLIPLRGVGVENRAIGQTRCGFDVLVSSRDVPDEGIFSADKPRPNPAESQFSVEFSAYVTKSGELPEASVYNPLGRLVANALPAVLQSASSHSGSAVLGEYRISTRDIPSGTYYIIIPSPDGRIVYPVSVVK